MMVMKTGHLIVKRMRRLKSEHFGFVLVKFSVFKRLVIETIPVM